MSKGKNKDKPKVVQATESKEKQELPASPATIVVDQGLMQVQEKSVPEVEAKARRSSYPFGDLVAHAASSAKIPRSYAHKCIKAFLGEAKVLISQGHSVNFSQFGSFDARMIHAKVITTPQGKKIQTIDRVRVRFHNSTRLNELMDAVGTKALEKQGFSDTAWKPTTMPVENGKIKENTILDATEAELDRVLELEQDNFDV